MKPIFMAALAVLVFITTAAAQGLDELARGLDSPQAAVRLEAVRNLALEYPGQSTTYMLKAVKDPDDLVRERAVQAIGILGGAQAEPTLVQSLRDPAWFVRWRAVQSLSKLGSRSVVGELAPLAADPSWQVRASSYEMLGDIARARLRPRSGEAAPNPSDSRIRDLLVKGLEDRDESVRLAAATQLAKIADGAVYQPLIGLLQGGSLFARDGAALALGLLGDKRAIGPLIEAVADPRNVLCEEGRDWARWGAVKALVALTGKNFNINLAEWRRWYSENGGR